ncbi:MAG: hypothetical protein Q8M67_03025 [Bacteroidota bacterium]|nr:hypothetical protein [Bacteroidota bacterium]
MKLLVFFGLLLFLFACSDQVVDVQTTDLTEHNMKIIPDKPNSTTEIKLVVFDDCTYNTLSGVSRNGKKIEIKKQFNGMMKWPCFIKNDTILIGKLPQGSYNVNYTLIDIAQPAPQNIAVSVSFQLAVSR